MGRDPESQIRQTSHSSTGIGNMVHPVEYDEAAAAAHANQVEQKHFKKWKSWLVPAFVVANVVMLVITMYVNNCPNNSDSCVAKFLGRFSFQPIKENPLLGPSSLTLQKMGALDVNKVVHEQQGWRLITCMWLHAGVFHLLANMLSLLVIGIRLEQEFGFVRIGLLYLISGLGGSVLSALFIQSGISAGASGALFGLLGGMLSELLTNWTVYAQKVAALLTLIVIIAINLAIGILPQVDNFAHIGGFVSGFFLGFVLLVKPQFGWVRRSYSHPGNASASSKPKYNFCQYISWGFSVILLIVGFTIGFIMVFRGIDANDHCSWCHYLTCVPTNKWSCKTDPVSCMMSQIGNQLNITCSDSGKTSACMLSNASSSRIQGLCTELCR